MKIKSEIENMTFNIVINSIYKKKICKTILKMQLNDSTNQCAQHELKSVTKHDSRNTQLRIFFNKIKFLTSDNRVLVKTFPLMYQLLM